MDQNEGNVIVKRYFTQRNMNREIYFYGLTGIQVLVVAVLALLLYLVVGNFGPCFILVLFPFLQKNKKKLSEGDPNYLNTLEVKSKTGKHYQDVDKVLYKIGSKWLRD